MTLKIEIHHTRVKRLIELYELTNIRESFLKIYKTNVFLVIGIFSLGSKNCNIRWSC